MGKPRGKLPKRGQTLRPSHLRYGGLELSSGLLKTASLAAAGFGELIHKKADHDKNDHAQRKLAALRIPDGRHDLIFPQQRNKRRVVKARQSGENRRAQKTEIRSGRNNRKQEDNPETALNASAVIGGTSLSGGTGTIYGAMLGAVVMQSLQSGMVLLGVDAPLQNVVVGLVLVAAVWIDTIYRRHVK